MPTVSFGHYAHITIHFLIWQAIRLLEAYLTFVFNYTEKMFSTSKKWMELVVHHAKFYVDSSLSHAVTMCFEGY